MTVLFRDFLRRLTGGEYDKDIDGPLYYRTASYPEPKRILFFNDKQYSDALVSMRIRDGHKMYWNATTLEHFRVLCIGPYGGMVGKGALISLVTL